DVMEDLIEKKTLTKYYWKARYPYSRKDDGSISLQNDGIEGIPEQAIGYTEFGSDSINDFSAKNQKNLFTITISLEGLTK
ncbi:MAG: hypothetical protein Q4A84_08490, partial [Neisseria sp.]|nr:hypothetical protein [Neisseria sp.]